MRGPPQPLVVTSWILPYPTDGEDRGDSAMQLIVLHLTHLEPGPWAATPLRLGLVCAVTAAFSALGYAIRGVSRSGAIAGALACFALFAAAGPGAFAALLCLFVVTWLATRLGRARKLRLGTAEHGEGRTGAQVLANLGTAVACGLLYASSNQRLFLLAMTAALAEAASDTVSSEVGQAFSEHARLITTFEPVPAGTDGGITLVGTMAGVGGAALVSLACTLTGLLPVRWLWMSAACGVLGMLADSYMGAWFERRGWLNNDAVNFISTAVAAALSVMFLRLFP